MTKIVRKKVELFLGKLKSLRVLVINCYNALKMFRFVALNINRNYNFF